MSIQLTYAEEPLIGSEVYQVNWCGACKIADETKHKGGTTLTHYRSDNWDAAVENCNAKAGTLWPALYPCDY